MKHDPFVLNMEGIIAPNKKIKTYLFFPTVRMSMLILLLTTFNYRFGPSQKKNYYSQFEFIRLQRIKGLVRRGLSVFLIRFNLENSNLKERLHD